MLGFTRLFSDACAHCGLIARRKVFTTMVAYASIA
jgi:hypothetical protein